jgi:predicted DNA-binding transcriptional regulator YafY
MRNALRDFRMDRISKLSLTNDDVTDRHPSLKEYLKKDCNDRELYEVVIQVNKHIHRYLDEQKYYNGFISETHEDDCVVMNFFTASIGGFARWFMMFGDEAKIIKPESLREKVRQMVTALASV